MKSSVRDQKDSGQIVSILAEIARLLESEESRDARVRRVLEFLNRLVPYECCALLVGLSKNTHLFTIPDPTASTRATLQSSLSDMLHVMEGNRNIESSGTGSGRLVLPVIRADRIIGVLQVERHDTYDLHHVQLLSTVASQLGAYLAMVELKDRESRAQEVLRESESRLRAMSEHDVLTDLPNRLLLKDRLSQAIARARRNGTQVAVLFLDLDGFKHINDSLGHAIGDKLLQSVAACLSACIRKSDTVSRQGGDEFVILLSDVTHAADAAISAGKIISEVKKTHSIGEHRLRVTVSIGLSTYPEDGQDAETLIKNADTAMYHAKQCWRGDNYQFFKPDMSLRAIERQSLEGQLRYALERQGLLLHYQPKVNLNTGAITSVEALIRWQHPERGLLLPGQFLTIAEDTGMIIAIGQWVLREACRQTREWLDAGLLAVPVAVNISSLEFRSEQFLEGVQVALKNTCLDPRYLELELTETVLMQHAESSAYALGQLKAIGVRLAVDDFGTGYSSLSYLTRFPIDALKLDQSFVRDIASTDDAIVVRAVISMGKSLKHTVIAEGVETPEQLAFLQAHGCDEGQGYYFSRPVVAQQFAKLLETGISATVWN